MTSCTALFAIYACDSGVRRGLALIEVKVMPPRGRGGGMSVFVCVSVGRGGS